jgi:exodeoxyribonuclease V beta subunit
VALHRYLKSQMPNYDIAEHLGGASYLYLRGMTGQAEQGYYYWKPSDRFILELDQILGYFQHKKPA